MFTLVRAPPPVPQLSLRPRPPRRPQRSRQPRLLLPISARRRRPLLPSAPQRRRRRRRRLPAPPRANLHTDESDHADKSDDADEYDQQRPTARRHTDDSEFVFGWWVSGWWVSGWWVIAVHIALADGLYRYFKVSWPIQYLVTYWCMCLFIICWVHLLVNSFICSRKPYQGEVIYACTNTDNIPI
eukprot:Lankesteria_metandrocarpae@DN1899_c0_g1_i1.p1